MKRLKQWPYIVSWCWKLKAESMESSSRGRSYRGLWGKTVLQTACSVSFPHKPSLYIFTSFSFCACLSVQASLLRYTGLRATPKDHLILIATLEVCLQVSLRSAALGIGTLQQEFLRVQTLKLPTARMVPVAGVPDTLSLLACWKGRGFTWALGWLVGG